MLQCIKAVTVSMAKSFALLDAELNKLTPDGDAIHQGHCGDCGLCGLSLT